MKDYAIALIDELENPTHSHQRFSLLVTESRVQSSGPWPREFVSSAHWHIRAIVPLTIPT